MSNVSRKRTAKMATLDMVRIAMLTAVSLVLMQFEIPIVAFYKLDFSNVPVLLGAFAMGPLNGLLVLLLKNVLDGLLLSQSLGVGQLADFTVVAGLILPAALIYRKNRTMKGAVIGMVVGTVCMAIMGAIMNYFVLNPCILQENCLHSPVSLAVKRFLECLAKAILQSRLLSRQSSSSLFPLTCLRES